MIEVVDIAQAEKWATEALSSSKAHRPDHQRLALYALSWVRALGGHPITDLSERYRLVSEDRFFLAQSPDRVAGQRHVWRGEVRQAKDVLTSLQVLAEDRAEPSSYALQRLHLCELMLRIGDWDHAQRLLDEWAASTDSELLHWPMYERCRALLAAGRGEARRRAALGRGGSEARGGHRSAVGLAGIEAGLGVAALLARDFQESVSEPPGGVGPHPARGRPRSGRIPGGAGPGRSIGGGGGARRSAGRGRPLGWSCPQPGPSLGERGSTTVWSDRGPG